MKNASEVYAIAHEVNEKRDAALSAKVNNYIETVISPAVECSAKAGLYSAGIVLDRTIPADAVVDVLNGMGYCAKVSRKIYLMVTWHESHP
jgi:hypothetical protein